MAESVSGLVSLTRLVAFGLATVSPLFAQSETSNAVSVAPVFEVISIRPDEPGTIASYVNMQFKPDGYTATHTSLRWLIKSAYGVDDIQIIGAPKWLDSETYGIEARIDDATSVELDALSDDQRKLAHRRMLQALLADRCKLTVRRETKQLPIYALVVAKHGPKLHEAKPGDTYSNGAQWPGGGPMGPHFVDYRFFVGQVHMQGQGASLNLLVNRLTQNFGEQLGRKIVDNTGLTGIYDFELNFKVPWPPNANQLSMFSSEQGTDNGTASETSELSLFTAIQEQLGLKLESTKGSVETIVIDHIERPLAN